ncbi:MAG TPA: ATP-binding cassette domain-containing protein [Cyclobacteriaceae bacterium]|nr:ATP-binding cassette domain-containing protein [Cyclobacteriaceae bacterium]HMV10144.1 ATP-binding cassette domain-containing protein [Cyclobacteriaceae bacterium]HMV90747.1 ATP-binding cassette domain-containing protein [Cyclobacteriaceae bacterium]HMX00541.1 ATP-binding cassette domain-containing protein [Cyclobacteriaceae bacterium]HMX49584.1 ATP-binding cassette domain-containing protein [Cyclobacteriaceae bacterium]
MISIQSLKKVYKNVTVLDIAELSIGQNESFGLVGNNGAGKTTLFRTMLDLIRPTEGKVEINGKNVQGNDEWKSYLGSFLDEGFLIPYLTPDEYFRFVGKLHNYSDADMKSFYQKFEELFNGEIIGKDKYISDLSKGNLKKVGIAAAFMGTPQIIMLDEPFENLDPTSQIRVKNLLLEERKQRSITYLISSHDLNHVTEICERIVILEKGKVIQDLRGNQNMLAELEAYFKA